MTVARRSTWLRISLIFLWILSGAQILNMAAHPFFGSNIRGIWAGNHWDFDVYRAAHDAYRDGENPLDLSSLEKRGQGIPYNYSPAFTKATMWFFDGPRDSVEYKFIVTKIIAILLGFFTLVKGLRLRGAMVPIAAFLTTYGFGSGLLIDMTAGNITSVEFLWVSLLAVGAYRRSDPLFLLGLFLLCLGKPIWGIFAAVPVLFWWDKRALRTFALGVGAFALPLILSVLISKPQTVQYLTASFGFRENGWINPCLREFLAEFMSRIGLGGKTSTLAWFAAAAGLIYWAAQVRKSLGASAAGLAFGASSLLLSPFILPRFKPYAFALLIPFLLISLISVQRDARATKRILLFATAPFLILVTVPFVFALVSYGFGFLRILGYYPLFLLTATFVSLNPGVVKKAVEQIETLFIQRKVLRVVAVGLTLFIVVVSVVKAGAAFRRLTTDTSLQISTDLTTYTRVAGAVRSGGVPFRDFTLEYPPTAAYYLAVPAPKPPFTRRAYFDRFVHWSEFWTAGLLCAFILLSAKRFGAVKAAGVGILACFLVGTNYDLTYLRFDVPISLAVAIALLLALDSKRVAATEGSMRHAASGLLLGIGAGLKLYPALLVPGGFKAAGRSRIAFLGGVALGLLPTIALILVGMKGIGSFVAYHTGRHVELGSIWSSLARRLFPWTLKIDFGSAECRFAQERGLITLASLFTLVATFAPFVLLRRGLTPHQILRVSIVSLYGFVFFNKVGSPQYAFWLLGATLAGMGDSPRRAWLTFGATAIGALAAADSMTNFDVYKTLDVAVNFVDLKNVIIAVGYGVAIWAMRDAFRHPSDAADGSNVPLNGPKDHRPSGELALPVA